MKKVMFFNLLTEHKKIEEDLSTVTKAIRRLCQEQEMTNEKLALEWLEYTEDAARKRKTELNKALAKNSAARHHLKRMFSPTVLATWRLEWQEQNETEKEWMK